METQIKLSEINIISKLGNIVKFEFLNDSPINFFNCVTKRHELRRPRFVVRDSKIAF